MIQMFKKMKWICGLGTIVLIAALSSGCDDSNSKRHGSRSSQDNDIREMRKAAASAGKLLQIEKEMLDAIANDDPQKMYEATKSAISTSYQMANENAARNRRKDREYDLRSFKEDMENAKQAVEVTGKLLEVEKEMLDVLIDLSNR